MHNLFVKKIRICLVLVFLLSGLTIMLTGQTIYPLNIESKYNWVVRSDNHGNLYILWGGEHKLYVGKIENRVVTGETLVADNAVSSKYGMTELSVQPNGQTISVFYQTITKVLRHAWRDSGGSWHEERIPAEPSENGYWFFSGAVDKDGTVHVIYAVAGTYFYAYKKGTKWSKSIPFDGGGVSGGHMVVDPNGGIHIIWMASGYHVVYRYAPPGQTLDKSYNENINVKGIPTLGTGGLYVTPSGAVHVTMGGSHRLWHTVKAKAGTGSFQNATCPSLGAIEHTENDTYDTVGADEYGKAYVSWGEARDKENGTNCVKLSVFENGKWKIRTVSQNTHIASNNMPYIAMTKKYLNLVYNKRDGMLHLYTIPLIPVVSAIVNSVTLISERSFFKSFHFNHITWEDDTYNIENNIHIDHYNIYRKAISATKYDATPLATNIPASIHTFEDESAETNVAVQNFEYYVTTVALINGKLVESAIVY